MPIAKKKRSMHAKCMDSTRRKREDTRKYDGGKKDMNLNETWMRFALVISRIPF